MKRVISIAVCALACGALSVVPATAQEIDESFNQKQVAFSAELPLREGRLVGVLLDDWTFCFPKTGNIYRVPRSYITDYASVPWYSEYFGFSEFGPHKYAALIHDWLYSVGEGKGTPQEGARRKEADQIFLYGLKLSGMGAVKRRAMYRAVRVGGGSAYGRPEEWNERFAVLRGNSIDITRLATPPDKPAKAATANVPGCLNWRSALASG